MTANSFQRCAHATLLIAGCGLLLACGDSGPDGAPGAVSPGEAQALEEAAEMLDARALPPEVIPQARAGDDRENGASSETSDNGQT